MHVLEKYYPLIFLLMWSSGAIFVNLGLEYASVSVFLAIRAVGSAVVLLMVCSLMTRHVSIGQCLRLERALLCRVLLTGVMLQVIYQSAYFLALSCQLTPGVLAILLGMQPIITALIGREKVSVRQYGCLALGFSGLIVAIAGARELGHITLPGLLFGIVSVLAISAGSVMQKKTRVDHVVSAFYQSLIASVIFILILPFTAIHLEVTPIFVFSAGWMIVVVSVLSVVILFRLLENNSATQVSTLFYLVPLLTVLLDYLVFGHTVSWLTAAGGLLIIIAVKGFSYRKQASHS
jgi:drug/metabolite transporter (DMT)-like permease